MTPKVSIIIPFYNCAYVDQAVQSALNQTYENIEIIVVDDGSTAFVEKLGPFLGEIYYIKKENGGTATALNTGIQTASGDYIAWLSSDDYFLPDKISKQLSFMLDHQAEASFTNYDYVDKDFNIILPSNGPKISSAEDVYEEFMKWNTINGCTVLLKKEIFEQLGYFNPDFRFTHDYEMWFRILLGGYKFYYLDEVLLKFRAHEDSGSAKNQAKIHKEIAVVENHYRPLLKKYIKKMFRNKNFFKK
ncbi:glycosyltransferase family 2 protein [Metabacillus idriensis]|uniref:glycosyltransferase family 2 protein n=1 Tax=Metabacillus idriensis TaxID=324768 RepID=UPI00174CB73F|nr:glycosyltransferase [Metabacillus idriensis]